MKTALKNSDLWLYADDMCILYSDQNVKFINRNLNYDFNCLCEWFIDNKLSIHFGEDKTKSILFKRGNNSNISLNIKRNEKVTKQHSVVKYLQGRIQACFNSVQPLWAPKKTAQIFLQVQINNRIFR